MARGPGPFQLPSEVLDALHPYCTRLVTDRRGSTVWDVHTVGGRFAVKLGYSSANEWTAVAPAREAAILRQTSWGPVFGGSWSEGTWNASLWREGVSLYDRWQPYRAERVPSEPSLTEALSCAASLAELHELGWVHGDVQPAHFILGKAYTHLIDLALAHGGSVPPAHDFVYRGCLVHYEAPEISRSVLGTGTAVPTTASDVYALGASLFISATGWRHVEYPDDGSRAEQRRAIVDKPHRPVTVPGMLGKLIESMLSPEPADRPTSTEVCHALTSAL